MRQVDGSAALGADPVDWPAIATRTPDGPLSGGRLAGASEAELAALTGEGVEPPAPWAAAACVARRDPEIGRPIARRAAQAAVRRVELFGDAPTPVGAPPRWHEDPRSGARWECDFWNAIDYLNLGRASDVKLPWELSRLRHCVALAQGVAVLGEPRWLACLEEDLLDWMSANPMGWSVNWTSPMEVALRGLNLVTVDGLLRAAGLGSHPVREAIAGALYQHGWFVARNVEGRPPRNNHYLACGLGLVWLGLHFGELGESGGWLASGREILATGAAQQILDDGLGYEGSLPYHALALEMLLLGLVVDPVGLDDLRPTASAMADALALVVGPGGWIPNLGDDDGGRVSALGDRPSRDARRVLALAAATLANSQAARLGRAAATEDALWLCGPEAVARVERLAGASPSPRRPLHLPVGGIIVLGEGRDHVVVDVGRVGLAGTGGHGHLDAMSIEAILGGAMAVRDSGTATYTGDAALRDRLRSAEAHSGVIVDGLPYARLGGVEAPWTIVGDSPPVVAELTADPAMQRLVARQSLPARRGRATHTRTVTWTPGELAVDDLVEAGRGAAVAHRLHVPANLAWEGNGGRCGPIVYGVLAPPGSTMSVSSHPHSLAYGSVSVGRVIEVAYTASGSERLSWRIRYEP